MTTRNDGWTRDGRIAGALATLATSSRRARRLLRRGGVLGFPRDPTR